MFQLHFIESAAEAGFVYSIDQHSVLNLIVVDIPANYSLELAKPLCNYPFIPLIWLNYTLKSYVNQKRSGLAFYTHARGIMEHCAYLLGPPQSTATFRRTARDFIVDEVLNFAPDGTGEHCFIQVEKTSLNTAFVARHIASVCGVRERDVSYSGLKDRHAVATQWFSLHLPGKPDPQISGLERPGLRVLHCQRHQRKLRRGTHTGNNFVITLCDISGDQQQLESRLHTIGDNGFPNYFGPQHFGHNGQNIARAQQLFTAPHRPRKRDNKQGIYLSAARSYLFNQVLSQRIEQGRYAHIHTGDVLMQAGSHSVFSVDSVWTMHYNRT